MSPDREFHPETITVVYDDWRTVDGVRLFGSFVLTHGEERFTYDYQRIEVNGVDPAVFEMPAAVEVLMEAGGSRPETEAEATES